MLNLFRPCRADPDRGIVPKTRNTKFFLMSEENKENKTPEVSAEEQEDVKSEQTQENQPGAEVTSEATEPQVEAEKKEDTSETPEAEKQPEESQKEEKPVVAETEVAKEETT